MRVLVACRTSLAERLIGWYRSIGVQSVAAFSEADADGWWLDAADFDVFLNRRTLRESYLDPDRVVGAALDAGCDAIHPGAGLLAGDADLYDLAMRANVGIVGTPPDVFREVADRSRLRERCARLGIPVAPASQILAPGSDGIEAAATLQLPVVVRSVCGGTPHRVSTFEALSGALAEATPPTYLESAVRSPRSVATWFAGDRDGSAVQLGHTEGVGPGIVAYGLVEGSALSAHALALARDLRWVGVGCVHWAVDPQGRPFVVDVAPRLLSAHALVEAVHGIDLIAAQHRVVVTGDRLGWSGRGLATGVGLEARIEVVAGASAILEDLVLPEGATAGSTVGQHCDADTDPVLARLHVVAPDLASARSGLAAALDTTAVVGPPTNLDALRRWCSEG